MGRQLSFNLGGFRKVGGIGEHLKWDNRGLKRGDVVMIKVVDAQSVDEPARCTREDPMIVERSQKRYYRYLKRKFDKPRQGKERASTRKRQP